MSSSNQPDRGQPRPAVGFAQPAVTISTIISFADRHFTGRGASSGGRLGLNSTLPILRKSVYISFVSIDQIAAEALRLPVKERALLAASLWESLGDPFQVAAPIDDTEAAALALERDRQLDCGETKGISHEELMARLRQ